VAQRILVVEDEPAIAENVTYALESEGFAPVWKPTGREALAELERGGYDLVILDIMLPDTSGFEVCRQLRRASDVPVIFLTARGGEVDRVAGLELGADDYMVKPFSPRELTARVRAVLRRGARAAEAASGESAPEAPRAGRTPAPPFEIDEGRQAIAYRGRKLELSRYEYRILKILVGRPGWVYTREMLMELAWEDPAASAERTVDAHVKTLRGKLRAVDPEVEAILTRRGVGYALREDW
jgi:two-component system catabolic regulation response regulator CreB